MTSGGFGIGVIRTASLPTRPVGTCFVTGHHRFLPSNGNGQQRTDGLRFLQHLQKRVPVGTLLQEGIASDDCERETGSTACDDHTVSESEEACQALCADHRQHDDVVFVSLEAFDSADANIQRFFLTREEFLDCPTLTQVGSDDGDAGGLDFFPDHVQELKAAPGGV